VYVAERVAGFQIESNWLELIMDEMEDELDVAVAVGVLVFVAVGPPLVGVFVAVAVGVLVAVAPPQVPPVLHQLSVAGV
jgi:hypothetical protein